MIEPEKAIVNVYKCARCQGDHKELEFSSFIINPIEDNDGTIWNYWAMCPQVNEPILMKINVAK